MKVSPLAGEPAEPSMLADGVVITPSHNPPHDGGFKYNPPSGGPAERAVTDWIEAKANEFLEGAPAPREIRPERSLPLREWKEVPALLPPEGRWNEGREGNGSSWSWVTQGESNHEEKTPFP
jgi:hypothetical protein